MKPFGYTQNFLERLGYCVDDDLNKLSDKLAVSNGLLEFENELGYGVYVTTKRADEILLYKKTLPEYRKKRI